METTPREQLKVRAERSILVGVRLPDTIVEENDMLSELRALAETAGTTVVGEMIQKRDRPRAKTYLGKGKVEELGRLVELVEATLVIFDNDLTPSQIQAIEEATCCKVIDRSELILDIFANRATTRQARLQVEIAQLQYTAPRLRAMWSHLGQVTGGAPVGVGTRGPGEQQLEIDRRLVQRRLRQLKRELEHIQSRKTREVEDRNVDHYTIGLVGYTNAGKSTLFNRLTEGGAFAHEKLFATLGTRVERWNLGGGNAALLSDTVGFIRDLPHHLVASFRSTLEDAVAARLLLLVLDVSDPAAERQLATVESTLDEIGATGQPRLLVLNKVDRLEKPEAVLAQWKAAHPDAVMISAAKGQGLDVLDQAVRGYVLGGLRELAITTSIGDSRGIDFLERRTQVLARQYDNGDVTMVVRIGRRQLDQLLSLGGEVLVDGEAPQAAIARHWAPPPDDGPPRVPPHQQV